MLFDFGFVSCCKVFVLLKAMPTFVCLNKLVIVLTFGLQYVKVVQVLFLFLSSV